MMIILKQEFISSEQSDLGLHIDGEDNGAIRGIVMVLKLILQVQGNSRCREIPRTGGIYLNVMEEIVRDKRLIWDISSCNEPMGGPGEMSLKRFLERNAPGDDSNAMAELVSEEDTESRCVLKDVFPRLYALERHQNITIHTKLIDYSLVNSFRRNPRSGMEEFQLNNLSRGVFGEVYSLARKISSWWNVDCVDVSSYEEWYTWLVSLRLRGKSESGVRSHLLLFMMVDLDVPRIPKGCDSFFIALIPKTPEAKMVKDFKPISLIGSLYKIIAKILANRLMAVLGDIVSEVQSAFVADRQIFDGPFIFKEDYLDDVLRKFGFDEKWCGWIQGCLRSSWGSVLVNGSPTEEFQFFKGLKQDRVVQAANRIGCGVLKAPFAYLGSKVGGNISLIKSLDEIADKMVMCYKEKGGLGVSSLYALNRALMCKWVWRFTTQKNLLWTMVIKAIHGEDGKNGSGFKVGYKSIWRSILQEVETLKIKGIHLNNFMQKKLGNGADTYFWEDLWHGDMVLKQRYPRLYALEVKKTVDVASKLSWENFDPGLSSCSLEAEWNKIRLFPEVSTQTRWIKALPIKVNIHARKVRMDCLPTRLNISRRDIANDKCVVLPQVEAIDIATTLIGRLAVPLNMYQRDDENQWNRYCNSGTNDRSLYGCKDSTQWSK
ncbi:hypothetical protein Tco_1392587 [Tanacetum coccineum]